MNALQILTPVIMCAITHMALITALVTQLDIGLIQIKELVMVTCNAI